MHDNDYNKLKYEIQKQRGMLQRFVEMEERLGCAVEVGATWLDNETFKPMRTLYINGKEIFSYSPEADEDERALQGVSLEEQMDRLEALLLTKMDLELN